MSAPGGACVDLPPAVADKYFTADPRREMFKFYTARAICSRCLEQVECLEAAVGFEGLLDTTNGMIRSGEGGDVIRALRRRHFLGGEAVAELVDETLELQRSLNRTVGDFKHLRRGKFQDAELLA